MKSRKWTLSLAVVLLVVLTTTCYLAVAAEYGSQDDPLVTLSYINDVLAPEADAKIEEIFNQKATEFDSLIDQKMASIQTEIDSQLAQLGVSGTPSDALVQAVTEAVLEQLGGEVPSSGSTGAVTNNWSVIKLTSGQSLTAEVGCELLLRFGSAQCVASGSPGLINLTSGTDLANGGNLSANNLYIVTIQGRGIRATSDATLLINGTYTIQ